MWIVVDEYGKCINNNIAMFTLNIPHWGGNIKKDSIPFLSNKLNGS